MTTTHTYCYRGYEIVPTRQWASWCASIYATRLIYRSSHDLHCGLWHQGRKRLWPRRSRRSTACWHHRVRASWQQPQIVSLWCKQEQASIEQEHELIASGKVRIGEDIGSGWIDKTDEAIERAKRRLSATQGTPDRRRENHGH
jgi:hypothetical protein